MVQLEQDTQVFLEGFRKLLEDARSSGKGSIFITIKRSKCYKHPSFDSIYAIHVLSWT